MTLDGPAPDLLDTRAVAYLAMGRDDLAIKDLEDAVAVRPSPLKYLHLAEAYLMASRRSEATLALHSAKTAGLRRIAYPRSSERSAGDCSRNSCENDLLKPIWMHYSAVYTM